MPVHTLAKRAASLPLALLLACGRVPAPLERQAPANGKQSATASAPAPARLKSYPRAAWRLARPELKDVVLWVSHILIRHEQVTTEVSFCQAGWQTSPPPARTREAALALARSIAAQARSEPGRFADLARTHSEDPMTRERGGSLGGLWGLYLSSWPDVLDALAVVRPGEVSQVVETEYGFHVLYRTPPPPEQIVSGERIVIGHDQAPFLARSSPVTLPVRERGAALALANQVYEQAAAQPEHFAELVARYSEHPDAALAGDIGQWSTREPTELPRQLEVLSSLALGEVARPLETLFGWEILRRTPNRERQVFAMTPIEVLANLEASSLGVDEYTTSGEAPLRRASELARLLRNQPERFAELQKQGCCGYVVQWAEGRGWPPLMRVLQGLQPGEIAAEPIRFGLGYVIPKRVPSQPPAPLQTRFELPSPSEPNLAYVFTALPADVLAGQLATLAGRARGELGLSPEVASRLQQIQDAACRQAAPDPSAPQTPLLDLQRQALQLLGEQSFARYLQLMQEQFKGYLLGPS